MRGLSPPVVDRSGIICRATIAFMQVALSAVTGFALLAHVVLGCCTHHGHAGDSSQAEKAAVGADECCHEHGDHESAPADSHEHQQRPCDEADCSFTGGAWRLAVDFPSLGLMATLVELSPPPARCAARSAEHGGQDSLHGAALFILHRRLVI